jgi:hypothetical protein
MPRARNRGPKKRPRGKPFPKGVSANPGGRFRRTPEERALDFDMRMACRAQGPASIATLIAIRDNATATYSTRVLAACALLDRGWGRPAQTIDATINAHIIRQEISPRDEIDGRLASLAARMREDQAPKQIQ